MDLSPDFNANYSDSMSQVGDSDIECCCRDDSQLDNYDVTIPYRKLF